MLLSHAVAESVDHASPDKYQVSVELLAAERKHRAKFSAKVMPKFKSSHRSASASQIKGKTLGVTQAR